MGDLKTKPTKASVDAFLKRIPDDGAHEDCKALVRMMKQATRAEPKMWGTSMVGFGTYQYRYASGREGEWFLTGVAPRKRDLTLYIKRLADVDPKVLKELIAASLKHLKQARS